MNISRALSAYGARPIDAAVKNNSKKEAPAKAAATVPHEQVVLSSEAQSFRKVMEAVDATPEVRIPLVEEISQKIKLNGYPFETKLYKALEKMIEAKIV
ncbi:MAG: flagellar biosynthesis anti-sigma factor FlgM [Fibrobacter sp.]|nr:flagellar biosynthesis anti-sigma factor FlgM [Fibrobacter sp.]